METPGQILERLVDERRRLHPEAYAPNTKGEQLFALIEKIRLQETTIEELEAELERRKERLAIRLAVPDVPFHRTWA